MSNRQLPSALTGHAFPPENMVRRSALASVFLIAAAGWKSAAAAITIPLCYTALGTRDTGAWLVLQSIASYLQLAEAGIGQLAANAAGEAYAIGDREQVNRILSTATAVLAGGALALAALFAAIAAVAPLECWILRSTPAAQPGFRGLLIVTVLFSLARLPVAAIAGVLSGFRDIHWRASVESVQTTVLLAVTGAVLAAGGTLRWLVVSVSVSGLVSYIAYWGIARRRHPFLSIRLSSCSRALAVSMIRKSGQYAVLTFCNMTQRLLPVVITSRYLGVDAVPTVYLLCMVFRNVLLFGVDALTKGLQPYVVFFSAHNCPEFARAQWGIANKLVILLAAAGTPTAVLLYSPAVHAVYGSRCVPDMLSICAFALTFFIEASLTPGVNFAIALGRFRELAAIWAANTAISIGAAFIACAAFATNGLPAFATGVLISYLAVYAPWHLAVFRRLFGGQASDPTARSWVRAFLLLTALLVALAFIGTARLGYAAAAAALAIPLALLAVDFGAGDAARIRHACLRLARSSAAAD